MALGALFQRLKIWRGRETVLTDDLNNEFQNINNNLRAEKLGGHSETVSQMQETFDPGEVGSENQPLSIADEIKALRFQVKAISGEAQWYESPVSTIAELEASVDAAGSLKDNRIVSGAASGFGQPMFLLPQAASNQVNLDANPTALNVFINGAQVQISSDLVLAGLSQASAVNNTALVNDITLVGQESTRTLGEYGTVIPIDTIGADITALDKKLAAFEIDNGVDQEVFIGIVDVATSSLRHCYRGWFFDSSAAAIPRITFSNNDTITLLRLSWVFVNTTPALFVTTNQPAVSPTAPSGPLAGDMWLDLTVNRWKKFNGGTWVDANAVFVGFCCVDSAIARGARAADFANPFERKNSFGFNYVDSNTVKSNSFSNKLSVYGQSLFFEQAYATFVMPTNLDTGVIESISTTYYLYVTPSGSLFISDIVPHDRQFDLLGFYHPHKPYRAVAQIDNDGASNFLSTSLLVEKYSEDGFASPEKIDQSKQYAFSAIRVGTTTTGIIDSETASQVRLRDGVRLGVSGVQMQTGGAADTLRILNNNARLQLGVKGQLKDDGDDGVFEVLSGAGTNFGSVVVTLTNTGKGMRLLSGVDVVPAIPGQLTVTFPTAFSGVAIPPHVVATVNSSIIGQTVYVTSITTTQFTIVIELAQATSVQWMAFGKYT